MQNITFSDATLEDADALLSLVHQLEHFISKESLLNNLSRNLADKDYRIFVAKYNNTVVAFAELHFTHFIHETNPRARLTSFCVDSTFRNKNIGSEFLKYIEEFCRTINYLRIELTSNIRRSDAHRFYENNGYVFASKRFYKELA
ncbi:MAG TPA: GNAT family N-acetyltransferase [Chitinophagales bacterium]|nr:GNAT family N-acetyltransferase [Chitinophagales bacterium]